MALETYVKDLLYRYDCVIIPNFGGFVTNRIGAKLDRNASQFYPPKKQITFNSHLKINDGLLANYIVALEQISYDDALLKINSLVNSWKNNLQNEPLVFEDLGTLKLNEHGKILFEPATKINYLTDSFGLTAYPITSLEKSETKVIPLTNTTTTKDKKGGIPAFIKYAATAAILLTLGIAGYTSYNEYQQKETLAKQEKALEQKIQAATFVIENPLPTLTLNVAKEKVKPYHVVAGAFQFPENAAKKVSQLKKKGYNASILGVNKWGLTEVAFESFSDKNDAINTLYKIQDTVSKDAWLLVKK